MRVFKDFSVWKALLLFLLFFSYVCQGELQTVSAKEIQSIKIQGLKIKILFKHTRSKNLQIEWQDTFSVKTRKAVLEITDSSYRSKRSWKPSLLFSKKETVLKITGPSKSVSIFSAYLKVNFEKWKSPVFISSHRAQISGKQNESSWNLFSRESTLKLDRHKGSIYFKGFSLNAKIKDFSKTDSHFYFNDGLLKVTQGSGSIFFTTDKAKIDIKKFEGNLVGATRSGPVNVTIKTDKIVDVSSQEGEVRFYFKKTGPRFFAYTEKGKIYAPRHMNKEYSGKSLKVTGRIKGKRQGKVSLKTDTGNIYVY